MRYATSIYTFLTNIHYLCFIFLILTYVQALDVGAWKCPEGIVYPSPISGRCINSRSTECKKHYEVEGQNVTNCRCDTYSMQNPARITCYCCKVKS
ncbi:unnamed protein product [Brassica rapa]|uniref:S-locus pollen protein n=1 Tax=Brassica campestris TaxID=3711 RepID=Q8S9C3_BRACM|nr:S-locus pollen protein [Brassica rapa]CAG7903944.1 unnamed protein product [Brassica rapa]VDD01345.1 unnamed protein product [Brassica rapa]